MNSRVSTTSIAAASTALLLSLGLVGCSSGDSSSTSSSSSASSSVVAGSGDVVALAEAFAATLDGDQTSALLQDYTFANASNWSNFPNALLTGGGGFGGGSGGGMPSGGMTSGAMPSGGPAGP